MKLSKSSEQQLPHLGTLPAAFDMHSTPGRDSYSHPTLVSLSLETKPSIFSGISLPPKTLLSLSHSLATQFITNIYKANTGLMFSLSLLVGKREKKKSM